MKKLIYVLSIFSAITFSATSCKKKETTPTVTPAPTVSNFQITLGSNKYTWAGTKTGFSSDTTNICVIYKDSTTSKYILTLVNENISSTDSSGVMIQTELSSLSATNSSTNVLTYEVNKGLYFQSQVGSLIATLTNPTTTPVIGTIYYGTLNGTATGETSNSTNQNTSNVTSKFSGSYSAVYIGVSSSLAIK